jgi:hypothetical protein
MRALDFDYLRESRRSPWAGWVLLAIAIGFAVDLTASYRSVREEVATREDRLARAGPSLTARAGSAGRAAVSEEEVQLARETIARLSTPWDNLFGALESIKLDNVALVSIEPEAESGTVTLSGEARDYLAALTYVSWLSGQKTLHDVHLIRHEIRQNEPRQPVAFSVRASWRATP